MRYRSACPGLVLLLMVSFLARAGDADAPIKRELELVYVFESNKPEFILRIGQSGFRSVSALKEHLKTWHRGSELRWAPGCVRFGDEPLLSSEEDMDAFRHFMQEQGIIFVLVPSG